MGTETRRTILVSGNISLFCVQIMAGEGLVGQKLATRRDGDSAEREKESRVVVGTMNGGIWVDVPHHPLFYRGTGCCLGKHHPAGPAAHTVVPECLVLTGVL